MRSMYLPPVYLLKDRATGISGKAFWERMVDILQCLFLLSSTQVVFVAVTVPMCLTCVWCSLKSGPESRDSISLFMCLIILLSWKSCFLMCHHVLRRSQFLHPVRFKEAGMDRDTREQADSEGNGVVKISAPLLECRRQSPQFGGIRFTVNLSIPGRKEFPPHPQYWL